MNNSELNDDRNEVVPPPAAEEAEVAAGPEELAEPEGLAEPEKPGRPLRMRILRWALVLLIFAGLGALAAVWFLYIPANERLSQTQAELEQAEGRIAELESQVERMTPMENENEALQEELASTRVHTLILSSLADVNAARLALAQDNLAAARTQLTNTAGELEELEQVAAEGQREVVVAMQERLELALDEMERDQFAAQSDLEVLATNLVQLENVLFAQP